MPQSIVLSVHPLAPNNAVRHLEVELGTEEGGVLEFRYSLKADMSGVRVPPSSAEGRAHGLWKHTCFEAFVAPEHAHGYYELNFSPSLCWAIYRFSAYREQMSPVEIGRGPEISVRRDADGLELKSIVRL